MDIPSIHVTRSTRRELHGLRPAPLKVNKDSHRVKKPRPPQPPVIIYTLSPKIIHANPEEFMPLVQRLTGLNSSCSSSVLNKYSASTSSSTDIFQENTSGAGAVSPVQRLASIEKTKSVECRETQAFDHDTRIMGRTDVDAEMQRTANELPGILSLNPNVLPPIIPPNLLSPVLHNRIHLKSYNFMPGTSITLNPFLNNLDLLNTSFDL